MQRQLVILYRVFLLRVVDLEILSADGDVTRLLGQLAALLAGISFTLTVWLIIAGAPLPEEFLWRMAHFLITTTMAATGLFSAFHWDLIFPSKQDLLVLAPLPVRPSTLFFSKLGALLSAVGLTILALNAFTGLVWPLYFSTQHGGPLALLRSFAAYWISMFLAGAFVFCLVLAAQSIISQLLPRRLGLRVSPFVQGTVVASVLGLYILEPSLETRSALAAPEEWHLMCRLPSYWFLGLFEHLNGTALPQFATLSGYAWQATSAAIAVALALAVFSYWRTLHKMAEEPEIFVSPLRLKLSPRIGSSLDRSVFLFTLNTLLRSRHHRILLSFYLGIGAAFVAVFLQMAATNPGSPEPYISSLISSLWMMTIAVAAIRNIAAMPVALRANWLFRTTELRSVRRYAVAMERTTLLIAVAPVCIVSAAQMAWQFSPSLAAEHLVLLCLSGGLLTEASLYQFSKIPFTCSYLPGKGNMQFVFWAFALLVLPFIHAAARMEGRCLNRPTSCLAAAGALALALLSTRWFVMRKAESVPCLTFDEAYPPEIEAFTLRGE